jgi:hypothetical protein
VTKSNPEAFVNQLFLFKDFLTENVADVSVIIGAVFVSLFLLLFALREIVTWMTRTNSLKQQIKELSGDIYELKVAIKNLESKNLHDNLKSVQNTAIQNTEPGGFKVDKSNEKPPTFPIGY